MRGCFYTWSVKAKGLDDVVHVSSEASPTFGHANANLNHYHYSFLQKSIPYTVYKHRKICICMTECRAGFATGSRDQTWGIGMFWGEWKYGR